MSNGLTMGRMTSMKITKANIVRHLGRYVMVRSEVFELPQRWYLNGVMMRGGILHARFILSAATILTLPWTEIQMETIRRS